MTATDEERLEMTGTGSGPARGWRAPLEAGMADAARGAGAEGAAAAEMARGLLSWRSWALALRQMAAGALLAGAFAVAVYLALSR